MTFVWKTLNIFIEYLEPCGLFQIDCQDIKRARNVGLGKK